MYKKEIPKYYKHDDWFALSCSKTKWLDIENKTCNNLLKEYEYSLRRT